MMTQIEYDNVLSKLTGGSCMPTDKGVEMEQRMEINEITRKVASNIDYSKIDRPRDLVEAMISVSKEHNKYYTANDTLMGAINNYYWLRELLITLGYTVGNMYPSHSDLEVGDEACINHMMSKTYGAFLDILRDRLYTVRGFISSRSHTELRGNTITCMNGSFIKVDDGIVRYANDLDKIDRAVYIEDEISVSYILHKRGEVVNDLSISNVIKLFIAFNRALNHNAKYYRLSITNRDFINVEKVIAILETGEGIQGVIRYIDRLSRNIISICGYTRDSILGYIVEEDVRVIQGEYLTKRTEQIDISTINPAQGLIVTIEDGEVTVALKDVYDIHHDILIFGMVNSRHKGKVDMVIDNLSMGEEIRLLQILRFELDQLGLLELYSQPLEIVDTTIDDFFYGSERMVYINRSPVRGEQAYFIGHESVHIGYVKDDRFMTTVLIGKFDNRLPSSVIRFNTLPNVRKITTKTKQELKKFLNETHYEMFKGLIDL